MGNERNARMASLPRQRENPEANVCSSFKVNGQLGEVLDIITRTSLVRCMYANEVCIVDNQTANRPGKKRYFN